MSKYILRFIPALFLFSRLVWSDERHFVCKTIQDVFVPGGSSETDRHCNTEQGPPGKMGPPGVPGQDGLQGNAGPPGTVDYDRVKEALAEQVTNYITGMTAAMAELTRNLSMLSSEMDCIKQGGLLSTGKCYTVPYLSPSKNLNYEQAVAECEKQGALLAEIHDLSQQNAVYDFVHGKMATGSSYVQLWLGMEYNHRTANVLYRSGRTVQYRQFHWYTGYPQTPSSQKYLFLAVKRQASSDYGLFNHLRPYSTNGVVCEKGT